MKSKIEKLCIFDKCGYDEQTNYYSCYISPYIVSTIPRKISKINSQAIKEYGASYLHINFTLQKIQIGSFSRMYIDVPWNEWISEIEIYLQQRADLRAFNLYVDRNKSNINQKANCLLIKELGKIE